MKRVSNVYFIFLILPAVIFCISCDPKNTSVNLEPFDPGIANLPKVSLQYKMITSLNVNQQSAPIFGVFNNSLYFYTNGLVHKYDIATDKWSYSNRTIDNRLDRSVGELIASGDSLILFACPISTLGYTPVYNYISINTEPLDVKVLPNPLPFNKSVNYMSHIDYNDKTIICIDGSRLKIFILDRKTLTGNFINTISINSAIVTVSRLGRWKNDLFIFMPGINLFYKMNLDDYSFTEIPIPVYFADNLEIFTLAGAVNGLFCFWPNDVNITYCYDMEKNVWCNGGQNYFYKMFSSMNSGYEYYYTTDSTLYVRGGGVVEVSRE